jgi:hypothetical protein
MRKHLDKFIENYVTCKKCNYPELKRYLEGKKDLKSLCNSCGTVNTHDAAGAAGKVLVLLAMATPRTTLIHRMSQTNWIIKPKPKKEQEYSDSNDEINYQSKSI